MYQALGTPLGIVIVVENFQTASQILYKERREAQDPELDRLQFRRVPGVDTELWIVKGGPLASNVPPALEIEAKPLTSPAPDIGDDPL